jgi:two-component system, LytTR family, response regulator
MVWEAGTKLKVVIVDDEPLARARLRQLLANEIHVEVVAECVDGASAVREIRGKLPDLVFLDICMPELDGFGVLSELNGVPLPCFVFVTAHEHFAARAFEIEAVDYILKPFDRDRLRVALARARRFLRLASSEKSSSSLSALLEDISRPKYAGTLLIKSADGIRPLKIAEIHWIGSADNYASIHIGSSTHLVRATISALADQLPPNTFARISRSCIVNIEHIQEIRRKTHGDFLVLLQTGLQLDGSRNFRRNLPGLLGRSRGPAPGRDARQH